MDKTNFRMVKRWALILSSISWQVVARDVWIKGLTAPAGRPRGNASEIHPICQWCVGKPATFAVSNTDINMANKLSVSILSAPFSSPSLTFPCASLRCGGILQQQEPALSGLGQEGGVPAQCGLHASVLLQGVRPLLKTWYDEPTTGSENRKKKCSNIYLLYVCVYFRG